MNNKDLQKALGAIGRRGGKVAAAVAELLNRGLDLETEVQELKRQVNNLSLEKDALRVALFKEILK